MIKSFLATEKLINEMREEYFHYKCNPPQYASDCFKFDKTSIIVYDSLKVVINSDDLELIDFWVSRTSFYEVNLIGSDEVGKGDYFGPIVVVATYLDNESLNRVKNLNVIDSKNLDDKTIVELASKLIEIVDYRVVKCSNEKYNEFIEKGLNINMILALLHEKSISNLDKKCKVVVDQFVSKDLFSKYVNKQVNYEFVTKAEDKYLCVAISAIIARAYFINEMNKLNKELETLINKQFELKYGASSVVDMQAEMIYNIIGDKLKKFVKWHFKNTQKIGGNNGK